MTQDQATELLAAVHDLQQVAMAQGVLLAQTAIWAQAVCILLVCVLFFQALRRS